jgi:hypothetical protein
MVNETIEDELAETRITKKLVVPVKEKISPLVREKPIQLTILATIAILIGGLSRLYLLSW